MVTNPTTGYSQIFLLKYDRLGNLIWIRTCGGQSMLKSLPLERLYRDSRCGALMLPWTAEICLERLGYDSLYERGERDA